MNRAKVLSLTLFASLGLNLYLGGFLSSQIRADKAQGTEVKEVPEPTPAPPRPDHHDRHGKAAHKKGSTRRQGPPPPPGRALLRQMVRVMGGPDDERVQGLKAKTRQEHREHRSALRNARKAVEEALVQEPYEEAALRSALDAIHTQAGGAQLVAQENIISLAGKLTVEERAKLRAALKRNARKRKGPKGRGKERGRQFKEGPPP